MNILTRTAAQWYPTTYASLAPFNWFTTDTPAYGLDLNLIELAQDGYAETDGAALGVFRHECRLRMLFDVVRQ